MTMAPDARRSMVVPAGLFLAYATLWSASSALLHGRSDLDLFFWPAAQAVVSGHPLSIYATNNFGAGPFSNGPLGLVPLVPIAALADVGGWEANVDVRAVVSNAVFAVGSLLMTVAAVRLIRNGRGSIEWRLGTTCAFLLAPTLWISVASFGHFEQPLELWLILLAVGLLLRRRFGLAGLALGLGLLTRTTTLLYLIPIGMAAVSLGTLRKAAGLLGLAGFIAIVGLAPFVIDGAPSVLHALVGYRGDEPIGGGSIWAVALGTPWALAIQHTDTYLVLALAAAVCALTIKRNRASADTPAGLCGLLAIAAVLFPMLAKTAYPYYFLEPYVFVTIWWLARPGRPLTWRVLAPLLVTLAMLLAQQSADRLLTPMGKAEGVGASLALGTVAVLVGADLWSRRAKADRGRDTEVATGRQLLHASQ